MRSRLATIGVTTAFFAISSLSFATNPNPTADDSVWINSAIAAALQQGASSYSLPSGTYNLQNPIVIPAGAHDFTFSGAGSGQTIFVTPSLMSKQAIIVGVLPVLSDNWWITGANNVTINSVSTGQTQIKLNPIKSSLPTGYYVLWDEYKVMCAKGPNDSMNRAEVVKVTAYNSTTGVATIDVPAGREYVQNPKMCPYQGAVCYNITVSGFGFNGLSSTGDSEGVAAVGVSDGVVLNDLSVINFRSDAIMTNTARNVLIENSNVSTTSDGDAGSGYGFSIYRSRFVTVQDCTALLCRHGFLLHSGTMDTTVLRCTTYSGYDSHGYDERRISLVNCTGDGGDIGNDAWLAGAQGVLISGCSFTDPFGFHANVRNVRVTNTTMGGVAVYSVEPGTTPTVGIPAGGLADCIMFDHCAFKGSGFTLFSEEGATRMGTLTFTNCTWENIGLDWGTVIDLSEISGTLNFLGCTLQSDSADHVVQLTNPNPKFVMSMRQCNLIGKGNLGIWISSVFTGRCQFLQNSYTSQGGSSATFLCDDTHKQYVSGNTASVSH